MGSWECPTKQTQTSTWAKERSLSFYKEPFLLFLSLVLSFRRSCTFHGISYSCNHRPFDDFGLSNLFSFGFLMIVAIKKRNSCDNIPGKGASRSLRKAQRFRWRVVGQHQESKGSEGSEASKRCDDGSERWKQRTITKTCRSKELYGGGQEIFWQKSGTSYVKRSFWRFGSSLLCSECSCTPSTCRVVDDTAARSNDRFWILVLFVHVWTCLNLTVTAVQYLWLWFPSPVAGPLRLQLPHGVEMNQVEHLLKTMIKSAEWSSRELMRYFRHLLLPIMDTFMEESQDHGLYF